MTTLRRINQDDLRNHNLSVVISTLLRAAEPMSRAELAKQTGLTKVTMSLLVSMLVDNGVVREGTPSVQSSYGRPSTPLLIAGGRYCGIGLQVNTDGYGTIVLDLDGTVVAERWVDADMSDVDADDIFSELNALSLGQERLLADRGYTVTGTGLALPGLVTDDMRLLMARNLGWEQLDLKRFDVVRRLDATAGNEANMAALAQIPGYAMHREDDGIVDPNASFIYLSTDVGIGGAVGLLIASIGLNTSGLAAAGEDGSFINFSDKSVQLGLIGLAIALLLTYLKITVNGRTYKIKGALLISIVLTTIIGIPMGVTVLPENIFTRGALASIGNVAFQVDILGALKLSFVPFIIMLLINDFFGTLGTGLAMAGKAGLLDEDGNFPAFGKVFLVDSSATILGSLFGITTVSCFAESAAGVESGSRTGLSNLSTAFFFLLCMLFSPLFLMIPGAATGSALIVVGISMLETLRDVDFSGSEFLPVAVMLLVTAYKGDYVAGIALGMFTYLVVSVIRALVNRDAKYVPQWPAWVLGVLMVLYFIF